VKFLAAIVAVYVVGSAVLLGVAVLLSGLVAWVAV